MKLGAESRYHLRISAHEICFGCKTLSQMGAADTQNFCIECIVPDAHLADAIKTSPFDFLFVQFYNTPQCSARAYFDHSYGGTQTNISFSGWVDFVQKQSYNPNTKVYLGLPAAADNQVVYDPKMYLQPDEAKELIEVLRCGYKHEFGGVMIYEATYSENNQINGQPYAVSFLSQVIPSILVDHLPLNLRVFCGSKRSILALQSRVCC